MQNSLLIQCRDLKLCNASSTCCRLAQEKGGANPEVSVDTLPALPVRTFNFFLKFLKILILIWGQPDVGPVWETLDIMER